MLCVVIGQAVSIDSIFDVVPPSAHPTGSLRSSCAVSSQDIRNFQKSLIVSSDHSCILRWSMIDSRTRCGLPVSIQKYG